MALRANPDLVDRVDANAGRKGATPGQLALAWLWPRADDVVPNPGTERVRYLEENVGAASVRLAARTSPRGGRPCHGTGWPVAGTAI